MNFRATTLADSGQISALLAPVFGAKSGGSLLDPATIVWKYWEPRADWSGPRSFAIESAGRIIAHAGIWPVEFTHNGSVVRGVHMIDWAASKRSPGAGISLVRELSGMFDFMFTVGGSAAARRVLPALGFKRYTENWVSARPLCPVRQILTHQTKNWKSLPRLFRNWYWARSPGPGATDGWRIENRQRCPIARHSVFELVDKTGVPRGHLALSLVRGQARLAGIWLHEPTAAHWRIALLLAQTAARTLPGANELVATGTAGTPTESAAQEAGLRRVNTAPVFLLNRAGRVHFPADFQFQGADSDSTFLDGGRPDYQT